MVRATAEAPETFVIGIDLHGTLLDKRQAVTAQAERRLLGIAQALKEKSHWYLCTGNDLTFVNETLSPELLNLFEGYVLETGCVISDKTDERVLATAKQISLVKGLERELRRRRFSQLSHYARRLATISMFTRDPYGATPPHQFRSVVNDWVDRLGCGDLVDVFHSSVAVDIVPSGHSKYTGLRAISGGTMPIVGIADSGNDLDLLLRVDQAFSPGNIDSFLVAELEGAGKLTVSIEANPPLFANAIVVASQPETLGLIECLEYLFETLL